jgi:hypothetical protein
MLMICQQYAAFDDASTNLVVAEQGRRTDEAPRTRVSPMATNQRDAVELGTTLVVVDPRAGAGDAVENGGGVTPVNSPKESHGSSTQEAVRKGSSRVVHR